MIIVCNFIPTFSPDCRRSHHLTSYFSKVSTPWAGGYPPPTPSPCLKLSVLGNSLNFHPCNRQFRFCCHKNKKYTWESLGIKNEHRYISKLANQCEVAWSAFKITKNNKNFNKMTVSKFKRGQNISVIVVANKPEISSLKNKFSISRPNPFIKFMERSILNIMANRTQVQTF